MAAIDPPTCCPECGGALSWNGETEETTIGYFSPPGHDHDDNCQRRTYWCERGHQIRGSVQRTCPLPSCEWHGKADCCGYKGGPKWKVWPTVPEPAQDAVIGALLERLSSTDAEPMPTTMTADQFLAHLRGDN